MRLVVTRLDCPRTGDWYLRWMAEKSNAPGNPHGCVDRFCALIAKAMFTIRA